MPKKINFEHPLTERCRILLRIEFVFSRILRHLSNDSGKGGEATVDALVEAANLFGRSDLKSELVKELDRTLTIIQRYASNPEVDSEALGLSVQRLERSRTLLLDLNKPIGASLREDEFFKGILQRSNIPAGTCSFDLPQFHLWLNLPDSRSKALQGWFGDLQPIQQAVETILGYYRQSAVKSVEVAVNGYFHKKLDTSQTTQLITISLDQEQRLFPEISGDRHRFSIRFRHLNENLSATTYTGDLNFNLAISTL